MPRRVKLKQVETGVVLERYAIDARELLQTGDYELLESDQLLTAPAPVATTMNKPVASIPDGLKAAEAIGKVRRSTKVPKE